MNSTQPELITTFAWGSPPIRAATPTGLPVLLGNDAAMGLVCRLVTPAQNEQILLFGCSHGALGVVLARAAHRGVVTLSDPHLLALEAAQRTLALNAVPNALVSHAISFLPSHAATLDRVVILVPASRALARRWLVEAFTLLRPGGMLTLAGANQLGVQSCIADAAALFGPTNLLGVGKGCRVIEVPRPSEPPAPPAWASAAGIAPHTWFSIQAPPPVGELFSLPGVFSYEHLDAGTLLLLQNLPSVAGAQVLDMGCGYGPLGVAAAALGAASVDMVDVNLLAVAAASANAARYALPGRILASDGLRSVRGQQYDLIISNPPFHSGNKIDTAATETLIRSSRTQLREGGKLIVVANRFLAYERVMQAHFKQVTHGAADRSYHVLMAEA